MGGGWQWDGRKRELGDRLSLSDFWVSAHSVPLGGRGFVLVFPLETDTLILLHHPENGVPRGGFSRRGWVAPVGRAVRPREGDGELGRIRRPGCLCHFPAGSRAAFRPPNCGRQVAIL
jgi:hypothetical protein